MDLTLTLGDVVVAITCGTSVMAAYFGLSMRLKFFEGKVTELVSTVQTHDRLLHRLLGQQDHYKAERAAREVVS